MLTSNVTLQDKNMVKAKVEFSALAEPCTCANYLQDFSVYREGETDKFFGFGVVHRIVINLIDTKRELNITKGGTVKIALGDGENFDYPFPELIIADVLRDEKTNDIKCVAYDVLGAANSFLVDELGLEAPYTLADVAYAIASKLELDSRVYLVEGNSKNYIQYDNSFSLSFPEGANFTGDETLRDILNAIAEVTQTIYYINSEGLLTFRRLNSNAGPVARINKNNYYELSTLTPVVLIKLCHTSELGDNLYAGDDIQPVGYIGATQYIRDNPFWNNRTNLGDLLNDAFTRVQAGDVISQLECDWAGNYLLEIGDCIAFHDQTGKEYITFLLSDTLDYAGYLNEVTSWEFSQDENVTAANPTTIGEKINQTFARVDKVNKRIDLVVSDVAENKSQLAEIKLTTDDITLRVESLEQGEIEIDVDLENDVNFIALKERVGALEISDTQINASISSVETTLAKDIDDSIADLESSLQGEIQAGDQILNSEIIAVKERVGALEISDTEIKASVSSVESTLTTKINTDVGNLETSLKEEIKAGNDALSGDIVAITERVGALEISDTEIKASVSNVETTITTVESNLTTKIDTAVSDLETDISDIETSLQGEIEAGDSNLSNEITTVKSNVSALEVRAGEINATVKSLETTTNNALDAVNYDVETLAKEVSLKVDSEAVSIVVGQVLSEGVDKVVTASKHYTFDDSGLNISSSDSEIKTTILEDGMRIYKNTEEVLTADNKGVQATDLHARTFLIIGENSRLEDKDNRTACFWIGPAGG